MDRILGLRLDLNGIHQEQYVGGKEINSNKGNFGGHQC